MQACYTLLMKSQFHWAGHIVRRPGHRLPKKMLFGELQEGKRSRVSPKKRLQDSLQASLKTFTIDHHSWEAEAHDILCRWRVAVCEAPKDLKSAGHNAAEQRRQAKKDSAKSSAAATLPCPQCPRLFQARIGLTSHLQTQLTNQTPPP